jgi:hypothetical protein
LNIFWRGYFQANISQCFSAKIPEGFEALAFYKRLRS